MARYVLLGVVLVTAAFAGWEGLRIATLSNSIGTLKGSVATLSSQLGIPVSTSSATGASLLPKQTQVEPLASMRGPSEMQRAVAKAVPAVVSLVESKQVPVLRVKYESPFTSDSGFNGFGMRVPVYQRAGTTTQEVAAGSGFFVRSDGYVVTNKHVVPDSNATYTVILSNGIQKTGTVVWRSLSQDLALVKISGSGYPTLPLGDSSTLALGESVFAVGNALGQYSNTVSTGIISGLNREVTASGANGASETLAGAIQTDTPINPGNSGGPLIDLSGQVVGINVATAQGSQNISFAIPVNQVKTALAHVSM